MKRQRKIVLSLLITLSLQLNYTIQATGVLGENVAVDITQNLSVVQINDPKNGLSHNTYEQFEFNTGVVLNNSLNKVSTKLLGEINGNSNLHVPANIILNEVVGTSVSHLNGTLEVAGQKADVILANPNGIIVNNLNFINTDGAVLTTGTPLITQKGLENISVNKGKITINGNINDNVNEHEEITSINSVELLAKAIEVNAAIFAKDKIKIVTGQNEINYAQGNITNISSDEDTNKGVVLDVSALGGMYAGNIYLIGTEKGLGVNLGGDIDAVNGNLHIDIAGNISIKQNIQDDEPTSIQARNIDIKSQDFENKGNVIAEENLSINSKNFIQDEHIKANQIVIKTQNITGNGIISADNDVKIVAEDRINFSGGFSSNNGSITLEAQQININKDNINIKNKDKIVIIESNPLPKEDNKEPKLPSLVDNGTDLDNTNNTYLTVDTKANKNNQPLIDKTPSGIDLVNIAQVDANGISKNKYLNFNVKTNGLILNNATTYTNTKLAGYIDKNIFLAGYGAKTIINEVSSTEKSFLNGFIEVAGNPADVVITNPNGIFINGLGFINSKNIVLNAADIQIVGKGFNALNLDNIYLYSNNFINKNSEILSSGNINIGANENLKNISADILASGNINLTAKNVDNSKEKFITDWEITEEDKYEKIPHLNQSNYYDADRKYHRIIKTGIIKEESPESNIVSHKDINIAGENISNKFSKTLAGKNLSLTANNLENIGYQGTIHYDDLGRDRHYWKYKKKRRFLGIGIGSKWVYGHTDLHYENHEVFDVEPSITSERIAIISSNENTKIKADNFINKTIEANGDEYELRTKDKSNKDYLLRTPKANFKLEEKAIYTDRKQFLASDYRYNRLKNDPENVYRRLNNAYTEQELLKSESRRLINESKLRETNSSIILGKDIKIYNDTLINKGIIHADDTLFWHGKNLDNLGLLEAQEAYIKAKALRNLSGEIKALNNLNIDTKYLLNETKQITFKTDEYLQTLNQAQGSILGGNINIKAEVLDNIGGNIQANAINIDSPTINLLALAQKHHNYGIGTALENINYVGSTIQGDTVNINSNEMKAKASNIITRELTIKANDLQLENAKNYNYANMAIGSKGSKYFNRKMAADEYSVSSEIAGKDKIILYINNNLNIKASNIKSDHITSIKAGNINITNDQERHELIEEFQQKDKGLFSSKTIDVYKQQIAENVINSTISSNNIDLNSHKDIFVKSSNILADNDINLNAQGNIYIASSAEKLFNKYNRHIKKSGLFTSGGLGITIGSQRQKDNYEQINSLEKGSVIGSLNGTLEINALGNAHIEASNLISKKDVKIKANKLDIINGYNRSINTENHEFKKAGLTLALSNNMVDTASNFIDTINESNKVKDNRLNALLKYKAYDDIKKEIKKNDLKTQVKSLNLNISLGKEKYEKKETLENKISQNSNIIAEKDLTLKTTAEDLTIKGSNILGTNVILDSAKNINMEGSSNSSLLTSKSSAKTAGLGISYDLIKNNISNININAHSSKNNIGEENIDYEPAKIKADNLVNIKSPKDLNVIDAKIEGDKIIADIQQNLNIKSLQNIHNYIEDNKSAGFNVGFTAKGKYKNSRGGLNQTNTDSKYKSVVNQAGIYAYNNGFDITVGDTTKLVGALLSSTTDKNSLKTKNLIMEDLENIARYKYTSKGLSYLNDKEYKDAKKRLDKNIKSITDNRFLSNDEKIKILKDLPKTDKSYAHDLNYINSIHNEIGLLPNILPGEEKEVKSITQSAIAPGEIEIGNALININRNIANSLNKLDKIFNKKELKERQETARLFSKYANEAIHNISEAMDWKDGSAEKIALHAIVGKLSMDIAKGNEITGITVGAISEVLSPHILKLTDNNPIKAQWIAYVLGYATDKALGGNGEQSGAVSQYGVKWNEVYLDKTHDDFASFYAKKIEEEKIFENEYIKEYQLVPDLPYRDRYYYRYLAKKANQIHDGMGAYLDIATREDYDNQKKYNDLGVTLVDRRIYSISPSSTIGKVITESNVYKEIIERVYIKTKYNGEINKPLMFKFSARFNGFVEKIINFPIFLTAGTFEGRIKSYLQPDGSIKLNIFIMDNSNYEKSDSRYPYLKNLVNEAANAMYHKELIPYTWFIEDVRYL